ncbi:MAG: glutamate--cysteine ligase [Porticoccaceae bacterium]|nr:glutamate--cysteine ligase [Porticoccaceae bacterium]
MSLESRIPLLADADSSLLANIVRGIEKESLRVEPNGQLAKTPHPKALGSALTHPSITTDYSEALLEFITAPSASIDQVISELEEIHRYTYENIDDELLWVNSMPCQLGEDSSIPVGEYGSSNIGQMKTVYRLGLGHRYGRLMQTIAGIHYNFSVPDSLWLKLQADEGNQQSLQDYKTDGYFALIRNFRRYFWLLLYLFGAAPAVCKSFVRNREHDLQPVGNDSHSLYKPNATSLRMGNLGYQSDAQSSLIVCYNDIAQYTRTLKGALETPYKHYEHLGLKDSQGNYQQLTTNLLQIENEFYSPIRPKRTAASGETPLEALHNKGVEYIEVRCVDLNPLAACGIDKKTIRFLDTFLLFCLLKESPKTNNNEYQQITENQRRTVADGRNSDLELVDGDQSRKLVEWGQALVAEMQPVATLLDKANNSAEYQSTLATMGERLQNSSLTPAAILLSEMQENNETYYRMAMRKAVEHREYFRGETLAPEVIEKYQLLAEQSQLEQQQIEASDSVSFDDFLAAYYHRDSLVT